MRKGRENVENAEKNKKKKMWNIIYAGCTSKRKLKEQCIVVMRSAEVVWVVRGILLEKKSVCDRPT